MRGVGGVGKYRFGYSFANGIEASEQRALIMFEEMALQGYHLDKRLPFMWRFYVAEPVEYSYSADYYWIARPSEFEAYKTLFANAGWSYICSDYEGHHIFRAHKGTTPIYTDKDTLSAMFKRKVVGNIISAIGFTIAYVGVQVLMFDSLINLLTSWLFWLFFLPLGVIPYFRAIRSNLRMARRLKRG